MLGSWWELIRFISWKGSNVTDGQWCSRLGRWLREASLFGPVQQQTKSRSSEIDPMGHGEACGKTRRPECQKEHLHVLTEATDLTKMHHCKCWRVCLLGSCFKNRRLSAQFLAKPYRLWWANIAQQECWRPAVQECILRFQQPLCIVHASVEVKDEDQWTLESPEYTTNFGGIPPLRKGPEIQKWEFKKSVKISHISSAPLWLPPSTVFCWLCCREEEELPTLLSRWTSDQLVLNPCPSPSLCSSKGK